MDYNYGFLSKLVFQIKRKQQADMRKSGDQKSNRRVSISIVYSNSASYIYGLDK